METRTAFGAICALYPVGTRVQAELAAKLQMRSRLRRSSRISKGTIGGRECEKRQRHTNRKARNATIRGRQAAGAPEFFERYGEDLDPRLGMSDVEVWIPVTA